MRDYLMFLETTLVHYCLSQLGWPPKASFTVTPGDNFPLGAVPVVKKLSANELDDAPEDGDRFRSRWGRWAGKEAEMYMECFNVVSKLTATVVSRLGGMKMDLLLQRVEQLRDDLKSETFPEKLVRNPAIKSTVTPTGGVLLSTYNEYDPMSISDR